MKDSIMVADEQANEQQMTEKHEDMKPNIEYPYQEQISSRHDSGNDHLTWINNEEIDSIRARWNSIQADFVDEPSKAVSQGDSLVAETLERIKHVLTSQYSDLNHQWSNQQNLSTEDLRITLQDYRIFLNRLLTT